MDSLCNYGSDDERSQHRSSYNAASDWQKEQDVNYEPVTMDMSEDSNEEDYYARKYGRYDEVAAAAKRRNFDPYEDDVSDAPTSPEPDPPTGSHVRDPSNGSAHDNDDSTNQNRGYAREGEESRSSANQNRGYAREGEESRSSANQNRGYAREGEESRGSVKEDVARQYGSYYERAKKKLSGEETEEADGDERGNHNGKSSSDRRGGFPTYKGESRRDRHDKDRSQDERRVSRDRSHGERRVSRDRSHDRDYKSSSKHSSSRHRDRSRDKDRRKRRDSRSRSRSRDKYDRKSSRRHKSRSRSRSRSSSKSRSHHSSSRHRRGHSTSSRRDRRSREPSIGELPRPYAPFERKPSKLQILEKLGIELKVPPTPGQGPHVIAGGAHAQGAIPSLLGINTVNPLTGAIGTPSGVLAGSGVTPQDVLQKTIAAQMEKIKADTGIELPKYYNPMAINPTKYAEQIQKRRLLWGNKVSTGTCSTSSTTITSSTASNSSAPVTQSHHTAAPSSAPGSTAGAGTIWQGATFSGDQDGRMTSKFQRLMGIKNPAGPAASAPSANTGTAGASSSTQPSSKTGGTDIIRKQEEMFSSMESQYEAARMATHTHRGLGLGFGTFAPR